MSTASEPKPGALAPVKPTLRGESHQYAACLAMPAGFLLTYLAPSSRAALGAFVYTVSLVALFGISACYHIPTWEPSQRKWMRRLDHAAIFLLIAGTYTPICLIALPGEAGRDLLQKVWTGAIAGIGQSLFWVTAPKPFVTGLYVLLGWAGIRSVGQLQDTNTLLMAAGGLSYTIGAVVYAAKRPNPSPGHFGYHEVFHALVILASVFHFTAVARLVLGDSWQREPGIGESYLSGYRTN